MTDREKAAFLRAQGWKRKTLKWEAGYPARLLWIDSHGTAQWCLWDAFVLASRRKAQREARALRKAGCEWTDCGPLANRPAGWILPYQGFGQRVFTRAEALKQLGIK